MKIRLALAVIISAMALTACSVAKTCPTYAKNPVEAKSKV